MENKLNILSKNLLDVFMLQYEVKRNKNSVIVKENVYVDSSKANEVYKYLAIDIPQLEVKDDYKELAKTKNRAGVTLVNFLNQSNNILEILKEFRDDLTDLKKINTIYEKIKSIWKKYDIKINENIWKFLQELLNGNYYEWIMEFCHIFLEKINLKEDEFHKTQKTLEEILNINEYKNKYKYEYYYYMKIVEKENVNDLINLLKCVMEVLGLENEIFSINEIAIFLLSIIENEINGTYNKDTIFENYLFFKIQLELVKNKLKNVFEYEDDKKNKNIFLSEFLSYIFNNFYNDFFEASNNNFSRLYDNLLKRKKFDNGNNTYYDKLYKYMEEKRKYRYKGFEHLEILQEDEKNKSEYQPFSLKEMIILFIDSMIEDIEFMQKNYAEDNLSVELPFIKYIISDDTNSYQINCLKDLFFVSKYYVKKSNKRIGKCSVCGRYYVIEGKNKENCNRLYKNGKTCVQWAKNHSRDGNSIKKQIEKEIKNIKDMIIKRGGELYKIETEIEFLKNAYGETEETLNLIKRKHEELKLKYESSKSSEK